MMNYIFSNSKVPDNIVASVNVIIKDGFYKTKKKKAWNYIFIHSLIRHAASVQF